MTPTQLRAFAAVVRLGSVKRAAADLEVSEAAVSLHVGQLRKELGDKLFVRTSSGLAFTPGGLRLASRATEMLSLQDLTILEVRQAGRGAHEQLVAEFLAQLADMQRHRRLGDLEVRRRPFDRPQAHHRGEGAQLSRSHPFPLVREPAPACTGPLHEACGMESGGQSRSMKGNRGDHERPGSPGSRPVVSGPVVGARYSPIHSSFQARSYCCSLQLGW